MTQANKRIRSKLKQGYSVKRVAKHFLVGEGYLPAPPSNIV